MTSSKVIEANPYRKAIPTMDTTWKIFPVGPILLGRLEKGTKQYFKFGLVSILCSVKAGSNCLKTEEEPHKLIV
jgi:hypothetical protein